MKTNRFLGRDWLDPELTYSVEEWNTLMEVGFELKRRFALGQDTSNILTGKTLFTMFFNQSLRTRSTFDAGIQQLGGFHSSLEPGKTYTPARKGFDIPYQTERISDVARMLSRVGDAIAIRMYGPPAGWNYGFAHSTMQEFASNASISIFNPLIISVVFFIDIKYLKPEKGETHNPFPTTHLQPSFSIFSI